MRLTGIGGTAGQIEALEIIDPEGDIGVVDAELAVSVRPDTRCDDHACKG